MKHRSFREVSTDDSDQSSLIRQPKKLNLPDIKLSKNRLPNLSMLSKNNVVLRTDLITSPAVSSFSNSNVNSLNSTTHNATSISKAADESAHENAGNEQVDVLRSVIGPDGSVVSEAQLSKTIAAIIPRNVTERDYKPNFYFNYRQSGAKIDHSEKLKYSKSFKINVHAPKTWLKSKYMPSNRMETNGYLIMSYNI
jgi:hypothetical protein